MKTKHFISIVIFIFCSVYLSAQDEHFIRVHFLYGSKPKKEYKEVENRWFGGILGGHVGIEIDSNQILNFTPQGRFHVITKRTKRHSVFQIHTEDDFYKILSGNGIGVKKTIVTIPISTDQKRFLDSLENVYMEETPYDYAFLGMRCGAAAYEILGQIGVLPSFSKTKTIFKIFYPRKLRKRLLYKAKNENWKVKTEEGKHTRKWEKDKVYKRKL